ncbi:MAG: four helix bundle protein [Undibacterium sp.]|nr:four helix bundle protein [Opitutaceae bacterium]
MKGRQRTRQLAVAIYKLTSASPLASDFGLRDQLRRAAVSVCRNIAEVDTRQGAREIIQFFCIAKGSLAEVSTPLDVARKVFPGTATAISPLLLDCDEIPAMLQSLINHRRE